MQEFSGQLHIDQNRSKLYSLYTFNDRLLVLLVILTLLMATLNAQLNVVQTNYCCIALSLLDQSYVDFCESVSKIGYTMCYTLIRIFK